MTMRVVPFALCVLLLSPLARAEESRIPEDNATVSEARERFAKGVKLYREGSLEASLAEFERAAQLAPSYRLQYNIAQVQYELHNYVAAMRAFRRYLAYGGDQISSERRAKVQSEIAELEARVAQLTVKTNVQGATIAVDEIRAGTAPLTRPLWINPGVRRISALKPGYLPATVTVTAAGGELLNVALELPEINTPATTRVTVAPPSLRAGPPADVTPATTPPRLKTWLSLLTTGALAAGAGGFALLARQAHRDFDRELDQIPNTRGAIEDARMRLVTLAAVTDALAVATLVAGGVAVYVGVTEGRPVTREPALSLAPTLGGLQARGRF